MSDPETTAIAPPQDSNQAPPPATMESEAQPTDPVSENQEPKKPSGISLSIWPPSQRTRDAVINRLIKTLSTESVLSKRYGIIPQAEAEETARRIEDEAFSVAGGSARLVDDDGLETLSIYSKDISKRMLEMVKSRACSVDGNAVEMQSPREAPTTASVDLPAAGNAEA